MKILVVFYSRHNHTEIVGKIIGKILGATVEKIVDKKDRSHLISWSKSAFDEELRTPTEIEILENNPNDFDLVVVGTPIWDGISPAVRAYLSSNKFKKVAFFSTFDASPEDAFYVMGNLSKRKPIATLEVQDRQVDIGEHTKKIKEFCIELKKRLK